MMALVAGVDSSTQSCKVVICDADTGDVIRSGSAPHPSGTEVDPQYWWDALNDAIAAAGGLDDVEALSIAAQQHGLVALDVDGNVIRPALLWNDTRSAQSARDLIQDFGAENFVRQTGSLPVASFTVTKLRWLRDCEPENAHKVAAVALPHDWLTWRLRGFGPESQSTYGPKLEELTTDRSDASGTGYFNSSTNEYIPELLELALGHVPHVPRVLRPDEAAGHTPAGILVGAGAGDNAGAALGLGLHEGDAVVSIGTSGTVFAVSTSPSQDLTGSVAGFADASGAYLPLVATLNAARVIASTASLLGRDFAEFSDVALSAPPGSGGVVLLPFFDGERTPNLPDSRASWHGLTLDNATPANFARASVEGMLSGLAAGLDVVQDATAPVRRILLIGGGAQSPAVQGIAAQVFGVPIDVPIAGEYVALGAAVQAQWARSGLRPQWSVSIQTHSEVDPHPEIRRQYNSYFTETYA